MKLNYIGTGDPTEPATCTVYGLTFTKGEPQEVKDTAAAAKLKANPTFEVATGRGSAKSAD